MNTSGDNLNFTRFLATHRPTAQALLKGSDAFPHLRGRVLLYPLNDRNTVLVSRFEGLPVGEGAKRTRTGLVVVMGFLQSSGSIQVIAPV